MIAPPRPAILACVHAAALLGFAAALGHAQTIDIQVGPAAITINHQGEIPRPIFGVHATALTAERIEQWGIEVHRQIHFAPGASVHALDRNQRPRPPFDRLAMVIDCQGDRYHPPTLLTRTDWHTHMTRLGREYGQTTRLAGYNAVLEFWNEPYLNWADRSRIAYRRQYYETAEAAPGGRVTIKGWSAPTEHLRWRTALMARDSNGNWVEDVKIPPNTKPGDSFTAKASHPRDQPRTYTADHGLQVYDPTQTGYWSGRQNLQYYLWLARPYAAAMKQENPDALFIAGWDFHYRQGGWAAWRELHAPTIDALAPWIDGLTEHHYGGDTRFVAAGYEVATHHAAASHNLWIRNYNTEAGGRADPAVPGNEQLPDRQEGVLGAAAAYTYFVRDVLYLLDRCPDKVGSRTAHSSDQAAWGGGGDEFAFRLLRPLRGQLIDVRNPEPDLFCVAAHNGRELVIAVFNDAASPRTVRIAPALPPGLRVNRSAHWAHVRLDPAAKALILDHQPAPLVRQAYARELGPRQAAVLILPLQGPWPAASAIHRLQYFNPAVLTALPPGKTTTSLIQLPPAAARDARKASLRLLLEGPREQMSLRWNGHELPIPRHPWIADIPLDPRHLRPENRLELTTPATPRLLASASLLIDLPPAHPCIAEHVSAPRKRTYPAAPPPPPESPSQNAATQPSAESVAQPAGSGTRR